MQDVQAEGKFAIDSPGSPTAPEIPPEEYSLRKLFISHNLKVSLKVIGYQVPNIMF